ncbi:MAG: hypothetical protein IPF92_30250 [Myxococcales bacterium]|nr:hypothetical protein [Myxococcales bacterium]MBL0198499.1 hypothetical protein [Myxococcales bacterium]
MSEPSHPALPVNASDTLEFSNVVLESFPTFRLVETPPIRLPVVGPAEIRLYELATDSSTPRLVDQSATIVIPPLTSDGDSRAITTSLEGAGLYEVQYRRSRTLGPGHP